MNTYPENNLVIYQAENGAIELRLDINNETMWATIDQIAHIFEIDKSNVSRHIKNIFDEGEIEKDATVAKYATVEKKEGDRMVKRKLDIYSLDIILAIGFRARSTKKAIYFRKKAGEILGQHITQGYTLNQKMLDEKKDLYIQAINDIQNIAARGDLVSTDDVLTIIKTFSGTWFSLQSYDEGTTPNSGYTDTHLDIDAQELYTDVARFKKELMKKGEATELFAQEKTPKSLQGILGNVMQTSFGNDVYGTLEEKAAHLLYFVIKNHPFNDGNKRTGAFVFLWFLRKTGIDFKHEITPQTLTALTLLVAQSDPHDKERIIGLVLLMFKK